MKFFTRLRRLLRINSILMRFKIDELSLNNGYLFPLRLIAYTNPAVLRSRKKQYKRGERVRLALESLGPIYVKIGQIISTRRDFLPDDVALELSKLQDRVPPFDGAIARAQIEEALQCSIHDVFSEFDEVALASASIAQVHAARLISGESVVVKVLRPGIEESIAKDMDLILYLAELCEKYSKNIRAFKPVQLVLEIAQSLYDELDLMREGANAAQLRRNFNDSDLLYIPKIYWPYCRANVLVQERIHGIHIQNREELVRRGFDLQEVAEACIEMFFTQVFRDNFFHADLHPGNIFVANDDVQIPKIITVDFGIVGSLNQIDQRYISENMLAFFKRDYQRVAELHIACGWLSPDTRIDQFEGAIRAVCEPILDRPLKDISFGFLLLRLFQVARRFEINIQPQLILLQKTLLNIEALSRDLAPELDLWATAAPHIEKWLQEEVGVKAFFKRLRLNLPFWSVQLPELPVLMYEVLKEKKQQQERERFMLTRRLQETGDIEKKTKKPIVYFLLGVFVSLVFVGISVYNF